MTAAPRTVMLLCPYRDGGAGHSGDGSSSICTAGTFGEEALGGTILVCNSISPSSRKAAPGNGKDKSTRYPLLIFDMKVFLLGDTSPEGIYVVALCDKILHPRLCALSSPPEYLSLLPLSPSFRDTRASEGSLAPPERAVSPVPFFWENLRQPYLYYLIHLHS